MFTFKPYRRSSVAGTSRCSR